MKRLQVILICLALFIFSSVAAYSATRKIELASYTPDPVITAQILENPQIIEEKIRVAMNRILSNPATLTINIEYGTNEETSIGKLKRVYVETSGGNAEGLALERANVEFLDVQLNTTELFENKDIEPVDLNDIYMDVLITEKALNDLLLKKTKKINVKNPKILLKKDRMHLSGFTKYGILRAEFSADGKLDVTKDGKEIWFHASKLKVNHMAMPRSFVGMIVKRMNPVLKLDDFPFKLNLKSIEIEPGSIHFTSGSDKN